MVYILCSTLTRNWFTYWWYIRSHLLCVIVASRYTYKRYLLLLSLSCFGFLFEFKIFNRIKRAKKVLQYECIELQRAWLRWYIHVGCTCSWRRRVQLVLFTPDRRFMVADCIKNRSKMGSNKVGFVFIGRMTFSRNFKNCAGKFTKWRQWGSHRYRWIKYIYKTIKD